MELILLIDFGSTYTKLTAVDINSAQVVVALKAPTTVEADIMIGLNEVIEKLEAALAGEDYTIVEKIASSSAAGGLRMDAIGLVPELTAKAARSAVLNSGAKLVGCYNYELTQGDIEKIEDGKSDIILLAGGTDGGNTSTILHNARALAASQIKAPVVVAGNRTCCDEVCSILVAGGKEALPTENVLPRINELNIEPARRHIREVFIDRIILAKGIDAAAKYVDRTMMPTPVAVLNGAKLLAQGTDETPGIGELILLDIGGATTDVHSIAVGEPTKPGMIPKGIPEPYAKRTVEGDMGVRWNAHAIISSVGVERFAANIGLTAHEVMQWIDKISKNTQLLAGTDSEKKIDLHLAYQAAKISLKRHAGYIETHHTLLGVVYALFGKDLSTVKNVIGTGGPLVHSTAPDKVLSAARYTASDADVLLPESPRYYLDSKYIMYAGGLLSDSRPELAIKIMKKYLMPVEDSETVSESLPP